MQYLPDKLITSLSPQRRYEYASRKDTILSVNPTSYGNRMVFSDMLGVPTVFSLQSSSTGLSIISQVMLKIFFRLGSTSCIIGDNSYNK
jgi:hypothetical protein